MFSVDIELNSFSFTATEMEVANLNYLYKLSVSIYICVIRSAYLMNQKKNDFIVEVIYDDSNYHNKTNNILFTFTKQ